MMQRGLETSPIMMVITLLRSAFKLHCYPEWWYALKTHNLAPKAACIVTSNVSSSHNFLYDSNPNSSRRFTTWIINTGATDHMTLDSNLFFTLSPNPGRLGGLKNGEELFEGHYFCQAQREDFFQRAKPYKDHPTILRMQKLAKELGVVIPVSFFEEANNAHYNSATRKSSTSIQVTLDSVAVYLHTRGRSGDTGF
ncbi:PREDICTED: N-carbamoylputrescine [Prunus dulcis]|uniref:PREDICTED: N-carbamoylputrescine n=1 Tax=Prunus dulcis TaxID=3755 RepID=A0A5E4FEY5_PRUDU|nr:PREDICTED: N-carbamoylputrescine [Prunus dulcis]